MPLLIDTYNVLHTVGVLPPDLAGVDVQSLVRLLENSRYRDDRITLVCDGIAPPDPPRGAGGPPAHTLDVSIRYSGHGKPADDLIGQLIRASTSPRRLSVVSSDHEVLRAARRRRCKMLTSQEFLQQLVDDHRAQSGSADQDRVARPGAVTDEQINRWIKLFNLDEKTLAIPARTAVAGDLAAPRKKAAQQTQAAPTESAQPSPIEAPAELPAGPLLPEDVIAEAEKLWQQTRKAASADEPRGDS